MVAQPSRNRSAKGRAQRRRRLKWERLAGEFEKRQDYRRLLARVLALSDAFQQSLTPEQRRLWLELEEALLDHSWFLHGEYFNAGYQVGRASTRAGKSPDVLGERRSQAALVVVLAKLAQQLLAQDE